MTPVALYSKYRTDTFAAVRNQDHIVAVLEGAIKKDTIPHALLFSGSRGTGKTTLARIFARALGTHELDTYELDAASNRGIDDARALKDGVHALPYQSRFKVYIIDEVHMLTKEAFNALLKTLEEPPSHVIFILATTEEDRLLDTIISRCQVFRFNAPTTAVLAATIIDVAGKEQVAMSNTAAELIALAADGSFRDALSITQTVLLAHESGTVEADFVALIIGAPPESLVLGFLQGLASKDLPALLAVTKQAEETKVNSLFFIRLILQHARTIMRQRFNPSELPPTLTPNTKALVTELTGAAGAHINSQCILRLLTALDNAHRAPIAVLPLEVMCIEHCGGEAVA